MVCGTKEHQCIILICLFSLKSSNLVGGVPKKVQGAGVGKGMAARNVVPRAVLSNLSNKTAVSISTKAGIQNQVWKPFNYSV